MKVIMLKDVRGVGQRDTIQEVADGYGMNFLVAKGFAAQATEAKLQELQSRAATQKAQAQVQEADAAAALKKLDGTEVSIAVHTNEQGHLYNQLPTATIAKAIGEATGIQIPADAIQLEHPIKEAGETAIRVTLYGKHAAIRLRVEKSDK